MKATARPYAEALFSIAHEHGTVGDILAELEAVEGALDEVPNVRVLLLHPSVRPDVAAQCLDGLIAGRTPVVRNFVRLLADKRRIGILPDVVRALRERQDEAEGRVRARVQTARALSAEDLQALTAALGRRLARHVEVTTDIRGDLIGGARVVVGDRVLDGSVAGHLAALRRRLLAARN